MTDARSKYLLTETAKADFYDVRSWSLSCWGPELTRSYFEDLHKAAEYVALHHESLAKKDHLTGTTGLGVYAVREHYLIFVPLHVTQIAVVALIRQTRDVPTILKSNSFKIRQQIQSLSDDINES